MDRQVRDMWRPVYEQWAAIGWAGAAFGLVLASVPYKPVMVALCGCLAAWRAREAWQLYRFRVSISGQQISMLTVQEMLARTRAALTKYKGLWLGRGYAWGQRHAQLSREILARNAEEIPTLPQWLPRFLRKLILPKDTVTDSDKVVGASWVQGLEPDQRDLYLPLAALPGHTLIVGTTRSYKTRLYELLTFQVVHSGAALIVFDPKGDKDWERRLRGECERAGRDFLYLHLAFPSRSIRLNPLATWNNPSEVASRISQLLASEAGGDGFVDFADSTINRIVNGMVAVGIRPTLKNIKHNVEYGVDALLEQCFHAFFGARQGPAWDAQIAPFVEKSHGDKARIKAMVKYYQERWMKEQGETNEAIDGLITIHQYDRDWFSRVIVRLVPLLQRLATGDLGSLLSPDAEDLEDARPVYTTEKILAERKVLYVGADTLANKLVGQAFMSMLLADLAAAAGAAYNFAEHNGDVYLFMDEAAEGINDQAIQILNKAGGAGFRVFLATQTLADFEAKLGKRPKAMQTLGNVNNLICGRVRDFETAQAISALFGETVVRRISRSQNLGSETEATVIEFRGSVTQSIAEEKAPLVPPDVLVRLPNLQYFAMVAGGHIVKGRLPIIES